MAATVSEHRYEYKTITVLLTNAAWTSPRPPAIAADFLTGAYATLAD
jgi:hypothetical protein